MHITPHYVQSGSHSLTTFMPDSIQCSMIHSLPYHIIDHKSQQLIEAAALVTGKIEIMQEGCN